MIFYDDDDDDVYDDVSRLLLRHPVGDCDYWNEMNDDDDFRQK